MTVSSTTVKNSYSGNGSTTQFAYGYKIFADSDLIVIIRTDSTGAETVKTLTTHYTVSGAGDASGGNVTFTSGNTPASGETVVIIREVPQTQAIDYIANDPFPAESHEEGLDRATMTTQQVQEELDRAIKLSRTNTMTSTEFTVGATDRANKVLAFDSSGEISVTQELGTFKGTDATVTTAAYVQRDIIKSTTTAQLNNVYICVADSVVGDSLTDTDHFELLVDAVSAATSATASATSATASASSATAAASSASTASTQASNASTSATNSANSATAAATSATEAAASADAFDDVYLGSKSSDPSTDNDGDALAAGMLYFNTTNDVLRVYSGSAWQDAAINSTGVVTLAGTQTLTNKTLTSPKVGTSILDTNGNELALLTATGSAVNEFTVANAATGGNPTLSSTGGDSNIDLDLLAKGTGHVTIRGNTNPGTIQLNCENNSHGQQIKPQPHSVGSSAVHTLPDATGDLIPGKFQGTNFDQSILIGQTTTGTLNDAIRNVGIGGGGLTLSALTSGDNNIGIGFTALRNVTSGSSNIGIGGDALTTTSGGSHNVAIGLNTLRVVDSSGTENTSVGSQSGLLVTSGNVNTFLGNQAGNNITSGSGNVIIGAVPADSATNDRQLKIAGHDGSSTTTWISGDSSGVLTFNAANVTQQALTSSSNAVAWDASAKPNAVHVTTENTTFSAPTNNVEGAFIALEINYNGSHTIAFNTVFEFAASTAPTFTSTDGKTDILVFRYNGAVWQEVGRTLNLSES